MGWLLVVNVGVKSVPVESVPPGVTDNEDEPVTPSAVSVELRDELAPVREGSNIILVTVAVADELMAGEDDPVIGSTVTPELMDEVKSGGSTMTVTVGVAVESTGDVGLLRSEEELRVLVKVPVALMVLVTVVSSAVLSLLVL